MTYVALLRGVNVGGINKVDMKQLTAVFEAAGMTSVETYINSGNVVFSTGIEDRGRLTRLLENGIREHFGLDVPVLLRDIDEMRSVVNAIPAHWANDESTKCDVFFLWGDLEGPAILEQLEFDPEIEVVWYAPGAVIRRIDRANAARSRLTRIVGTPLYRQMTIRNCNTARKLLEHMERPSRNGAQR
jgi:uncharacterized protein (DUF1697 family)